MAGENRVDGGNGIAGLAELLKLAGGTKTSTTSGGDTSALQGVLAQSKAQDPAALLQTIFAQAAGQIPGLTSRMSNAVGARSGSNSPVAAILQKLLQQTTLLGQQQVQQQNQANLNTQAQVADSIARNTNRQTSQSGTNLGKATQTLALLQGIGKLYDSDLGKKAKDMFDGITGSVAGGGSGTVTSPGGFEFVGPTQDSGMGAMSFGVDPGVFSVTDISSPDATGGVGFDFSNLDFGSAFDSSFDTGATLTGDIGASFGDLPPEDFGFGTMFGFKDGGLVDARKMSENLQARGKKMNNPALNELFRYLSAYPINYENMRMATQTFGPAGADEKIMGALQGPLDQQLLEELAAMIQRAGVDADSSKQRESKGAVKFAEGGLVTARVGGGRRSSAPTYTPNKATPNTVQQQVRSAGPTSGVQFQPDFADMTSEERGSRSNPDVAAPAGPGMNVGKALAMAGLLGLSPMGFLANAMTSMVNQQAKEDPEATGMPVSFSNLNSLANVALNPSPLGIVTSVLGLLNSQAKPQVATEGTTLDAALGLGQGPGGVGGSSGVSAGFGSSVGFGPGLGGIGTGPSEGDGFGNGFGLGFGFDSDGGFDGDGSGDGGSDGGGDGGDGGDGGNGGGRGDGGGGGGFGGYGGTGGSGDKEGGLKVGPGTGTSDSIPSMLSNGEYVIRASSVKKYGVDLFDKLNKGKFNIDAILHEMKESAKSEKNESKDD